MDVGAWVWGVVDILGCGGAATVAVAVERCGGREDVFVYDCANFRWEGEEVAFPRGWSGGFPGCGRGCMSNVRLLWSGKG